MAVESPKPVKDPNYHLSEQSLTTPRFAGKAAAKLGIEGMAIDTEEGRQVYLNLFAGYATKDGDRGDRLPKYMHPQRRGAFEIIVSDPKDLSLLSELVGDQRIEAVRQKAREAVTRYVEKNAQVKVTKLADVVLNGGKLRKPGNLAMAWFEHGASREGDPHRHGHLVLFNLSHDGGIWKGLELRHLDTAKMAGIYRDAMRKGLHQIGYKTASLGAEYEIVGVPADAKLQFSQRAKKINGHAAEYEELKGKPLTADGKRRFGVFDRPDKQDIGIEERRRLWKERIRPDQFTGHSDLVKKAKSAVRRISWRDNARMFVDRVRQTSMVRQVPERSRGNGWER